MGNYGDRIKKAREAVGLTQEQLGEKIGVTGVTIMRYEKNQREPRQKQLQSIASALGVSVGDLMGQNESTPGPWDVALDQKLSHIGYSIGFYEEDAVLWINYPDGTLEVAEDELKDLNNSADSYLRFKLGELKEAHKDRFKPKK